MKKHILDNFSKEQGDKIFKEAMRLSDQLEISENEIGFDGTVAALAGVIFAQLMVSIIKGNYQISADFFNDLENSFDHIGLKFQYTLEVIQDES